MLALRLQIAQIESLDQRLFVNSPTIAIDDGRLDRADLVYCRVLALYLVSRDVSFTTAQS